jgi:hypothetical protein
MISSTGKKKSFHDWPLLERVLLVNSCSVIGIYIGFQGADFRLSPMAQALTAMAIIAYVNLMFFVVGPRIRARRALSAKGNL